MTSIRMLRTFITVAEHGSFSAAAHHVALTPAAVGQQMQALEQDLNRPLFQRQGRQVSLNAQGHALIPLATQMLALYKRMGESGDDEGDLLTGSANLGAIVSSLPRLVKATLSLKKQHPRLDLHASAAKSLELMAQVEAGRLDCAILVRDSTAHRPTLEWIPLCEEPMVLLAPAQDKPLSLRALLEKYPFIRFSRAEQTGQLIERTLRKLRLHPQEYLELNSMDAIVDLVRSSLGVAILPLTADSSWSQDSRISTLPLPAHAEKREISLVHLRNHARPALISAIARQVQHKLTA